MKTNTRPQNAENGARQVHPLPIFFDLAADNFIRSKSGQKTLNRAVQELSIGVRLNEFRRLGTALKERGSERPVGGGTCATGSAGGRRWEGADDDLCAKLDSAVCGKLARRVSGGRFSRNHVDGAL